MKEKNMQTEEFETSKQNFRKMLIQKDDQLKLLKESSGIIIGNANGKETEKEKEEEKILEKL